MRQERATDLRQNCAMMKRFKSLETKECLFSNLPEKKLDDGAPAHRGEDGRSQIGKAC